MFRLSEHAQVRMHVVARCLSDMATLGASKRYDLHPPAADVAALASELGELQTLLWRETGDRTAFARPPLVECMLCENPTAPGSIFCQAHETALANSPSWAKSIKAGGQ